DHHRHRVSPFGDRNNRSAPAWRRSPSGTSVRGHAATADRLLIRPTGGTGRCRQPSGRVSTRARRNGQICPESHPITDTEPAASPTRNAAPTLTDLPTSVLLREQPK